MKRFAFLVLLPYAAHAADFCPSAEAMHTGAAGDLGWRSYSAKTGSKRCVANQAEGTGRLEWPAAGIDHALLAGSLEVAVCCFRHESAVPAQLRIGDREVTALTHREDPKTADQDNEDDFPDLIEDEAHGRAIAIRGTLEGGIKVDVLLRCTASRFADRYAFQFTVINRSQSGVEVDWDHLRILRAAASPSMQPVAGGTGYVFLTAQRPREAVATIELKNHGQVLGRFRFDGFTLAQ
jgi:hypothetical protein